MSRLTVLQIWLALGLASVTVWVAILKWILGAF